jgi:hypothetical protein
VRDRLLSVTLSEHNSGPDAAAIVDASAHYFLQVKQENRHSYQTAEKIARTTPFLPIPKNPTPGMAAPMPPATILNPKWPTITPAKR